MSSPAPAVARSAERDEELHIAAAHHPGTPPEEREERHARPAGERAENGEGDGLRVACRAGGERTNTDMHSYALAAYMPRSKFKKVYWHRPGLFFGHESGQGLLSQTERN